MSGCDKLAHHLASSIQSWLFNVQMFKNVQQWTWTSQCGMRARQVTVLSGSCVSINLNSSWTWLARLDFYYLTWQLCPERHTDVFILFLHTQHENGKSIDFDVTHFSFQSYPGLWPNPVRACTLIKQIMCPPYVTWNTTTTIYAESPSNYVMRAVTNTAKFQEVYVPTSISDQEARNRAHE